MHQAMRLERKAHVIFGWMGNLNLQIFTLNGRRDKFQQSHLCGIVDMGCARPSDSLWCCLCGSSIMGHVKPWVHALLEFRMVSPILLQSFLQTGFKTWEEICEYLERSRLYPNGRHRLDNIITPTLLAHQLLRSERERGIGSTPSVYYHTFSSLDTTPIQGTSRGTAPRCQCSCLPRPRMIFSPVHLSAYTRQAAAVSADQFGEQTAI